MQTDPGDVTGTRNKDYNLLRYTRECLDNVLRMQAYIADAQRDGDPDVVELFRKAQADSHKGAELGKRLLASRL